MSRETGSGKTPEKLVVLINKELEKKSLNSISKATGVGISALHRYQRGIGEPTTATLQKLADYFDVSVAYLRGEMPKNNTELLIKTAADFYALAIRGHDTTGYYLRLSGTKTALTLLGHEKEAQHVEWMMWELQQKGDLA